MRPQRPSSLITLTSDFGSRDPYVGIMRSRIAQRGAQLSVIDLTHQIPPFDIEHAGYWLFCCQRQFPAGTVHVAVVDPGVGSARAIVLLQAASQYFIAPDNGLLGFIAQSLPSSARSLSESVLARLDIHADSATFHGRDIMAPLAAELALGHVQADEVGAPHALELGRLAPAQARADGCIVGAVALVDHYGNALTTIDGQALSGFAAPSVRLQGHAEPLPVRGTYAAAPGGEAFALVNSAGMLELAARQASVARQLNIVAGRPVYLMEGAANA